MFNALTLLNYSYGTFPSTTVPCWNIYPGSFSCCKVSGRRPIWRCWGKETLKIFCFVKVISYFASCFYNYIQKNMYCIYISHSRSRKVNFCIYLFIFICLLNTWYSSLLHFHNWEIAQLRSEENILWKSNTVCHCICLSWCNPSRQNCGSPMSVSSRSRIMFQHCAFFCGFARIIEVR